MNINTYGFNLMGHQESEDFFKKTGALIALNDSAFTDTMEHITYMGSDHAPFLMEGITTFTPLCRYEAFHTYHTNADEPQYINPEMINSNVKASAMMVYALANAPELPASRMSQEQLRTYLIDNQLQEELVISGDWAWD